MGEVRPAPRSGAYRRRGPGSAHRKTRPPIDARGLPAEAARGRTGQGHAVPRTSLVHRRGHRRGGQVLEYAAAVWLLTTIVRSASCIVPASNPTRCAAARGRRTSAAGRPKRRGAPSAEDTMPSIPFTPRFATTAGWRRGGPRTRRRHGSPCRSRHRAGRDRQPLTRSHARMRRQESIAPHRRPQRHLLADAVGLLPARVPCTPSRGSPCGCSKISPANWRVLRPEHAASYDAADAESIVDGPAIRPPQRDAPSSLIAALSARPRQRTISCGASAAAATAPQQEFAHRG